MLIDIHGRDMYTIYSVHLQTTVIKDNLQYNIQV